MKRFLLFFVVLFITDNLLAQVGLTNGSPSFSIDFSNTTPTTVGTNPSTAFTAAGFEPDPTTTGRLNSNAWAATGFSDGALAFGGTQTTASTDYTRGATGVSVTTGGIYSYIGLPGSAANPTLMIQPSTVDFTPGTLTLRIQNNGTDNITQLVVSYNLYVRNDEDWSNSFNFSYSTDDLTYSQIGALDYSSPQALDGLGWVLVGTAPSRSTTITGLNVIPGGFIYIRWSGANVSGSGSKDEFGLDDINATATFTPTSTDYYRSVATGNWGNATTWETSPDNVIWGAAILPPTYLADTITIRNTHTVTLAASATADQLFIELGATLNHASGSAFTLNNGTGTDMTIQSGGTYVLNGTQPVGTGSIEILSGSLVRVDQNTPNSESDDFAYGATTTTVIFRTGSVYLWNTATTPSWSNRTYLTTGEIATYRITFTTGFGLGGSNPTVINGVLEANANITFAGSGNKTFVNGILGPGHINSDIVTPFTGNVIINGSTAILGGIGSLHLPSSPSVLQIGPSTTVTMTSGKNIVGDISLLASSYVDLGNFNLTDTGTISGGSSTSYIKTSGTGVLKLGTVTSQTFPIGNSSYNPIIISNGNAADYSARVIDGISPVIAFPTYGINRTWNIYASLSTPGVNVTFQYAGADANINVPQPQNMEILINTDPITPGPWSIIAGNTGIFPGGSDPYIVATAASITIANSSQVHYALGKEGGWILPIDCIISTRAQKRNNTGLINWTVNSCSEVNSFEVQHSVNNSGFRTIGTVNPVTNQTDFSFTDAALSGGTNLYRIKVNRLSGSIKYSNTAVLIHNSNDIIISSLAPNPIHNSAKLTVSTGHNASVDFKVYNMTGNLVKQWHSNITEGNNTIEMNVAELPAGMYTLFASTKDANTVSRFIKQ